MNVRMPARKTIITTALLGGALAASIGTAVAS
jgi:hypothetical protein